LAGTGKSTIARTIAREYYEQNLGANFFFSRGGGDAGHANKFFTSIAVQLATKSPSLERCIREAVKEHNNVADQSLHDQWRQLVFRPLSKLDSNFPHPSLLVVVDALDECDNDSDIRAIVTLFAESRSLRKVRLRIFITSRPETPIRLGFSQVTKAIYQDFVLHDISRAVVDHDIFLFLERNLEKIRLECEAPAYWPGEQAIRSLVRKAGGLFIWVATACRFIREGKQFAEKRLSLILQGDDSTTAPENQLNKIYITVLQSSIGSNYTDQEKEYLCKLLRGILGSIVLLFSPLSAVCLAKLLNIAKEVVKKTLVDLHSILDIPEDEARPIYLHHPSFRDFLLGKDRCGDFWVDEKQMHKTLADNCIRLMSSTLKRDTCDLHAPGVLATDVKSSQVEKCLPPQIQYACLYWVEHLQKGGAQLCDDDSVHQFLQEHLLHWLEALSLMRKTSEGLLAITCLESTIIVSEL
jgi:hypothetical protein